MLNNDFFFDLTALDDLTRQDGQHLQFSGGSKAASTLDFQEFCQEFAKNGYENVSEWASATHPLEQGHIDAAIIDNIQSGFKDLLSADRSSHNIFSFSDGNDTQVVPDMAPPASSDSNLTAPTFSQPFLAEQADRPGVGLDPYSWMQGTGSLPFGYPTRPLSSDPQARQQSLIRYRDKKARRHNNSTKIRYELRKVNADKRPRIKGRFVKPEELQQYLLEDALASSNVLI